MTQQHVGRISAWLMTAALSCALCAGCAGVRTHGRAAPDRGGVAVVQRGDTLYSIAFRNGLDYHEVAAWNGIGPDYTIYPGERLRLTPPPGGVQRSRSAAQRNRVPAAKHATVSHPAGHRERTAAPAAAGGWRWPTRGEVVKRFNPPRDKGIDIAGHYGQDVVAAAPGEVVYSGNALKGYGELVIIKHGGNFLSAYGFNSRRLVAEGQRVKAGQLIALMGEGPGQAPELHFEIRYKGQAVDPLKYLPKH